MALSLECCNMFVKISFIIIHLYVSIVRPEEIQGEIQQIKIYLNQLSAQMEKLNYVYLNNLEPKVALASTALATIDSNLHHLKERAHVWDTFQLYIASWNEQMATTDRKLDIINRGQEKLFALDAKIGAIATLKLEYKLDALQKSLDDLPLGLTDLKERLEISSKHNDFWNKRNSNELSDISSKIDGVFDKIEGNNEEDEPKNLLVQKCDGNLLEKLDIIERNTFKILEKLAPNEIFEANYITCNEFNVTNDEAIYKLNGTKRLCVNYSGQTWTVIQKRLDARQNFNASWREYRVGFGDLSGGFWIGNEALHRITSKNDVILRVELEDFNGNSAWAEYDEFSVGSERENYKLRISGYRGNATDSFSSHHLSDFSTYDRKNDAAPACCPCAASFGAGWWFNSCFEANLNGIYHGNPTENDYYQGIIWENWLGNYSLKKSRMMVRVRAEDGAESTELQETLTTEAEETAAPEIPFYEDP